MHNFLYWWQCKFSTSTECYHFLNGDSCCSCINGHFVLLLLPGSPTFLPSIFNTLLKIHLRAYVLCMPFSIEIPLLCYPLLCIQASYIPSLYHSCCCTISPLPHNSSPHENALYSPFVHNSCCTLGLHSHYPSPCMCTQFLLLWFSNFATIVLTTLQFYMIVFQGKDCNFYSA